ncbi:YafY family transcriptional regulator [Occultella glacieicola]|uniref:YafY family transcriptional regulator n=1 Tax=Occultella glacieicola TaxID=2518684 RepID=A0ABY2E8Q4_9MICO|nr:YafY family protein [Occultella glacieicola]TDE98884.1 YafY family transcriptional regulator [Occultella glacieicola]
MSTSTRALDLLGLLQSRRHWPGTELARRLNVSQRTLRRDVNGLQQLGYPIITTRGTGGGYQLSAGASLPPLVLSEDEAAATVLGLKEIATGVHPSSAESAVSAMAKIVQVLPPRIRGRIDSLRAVAVPAGGPENRAMIGDITALTTLALACRDSDSVVFAYSSRAGESSRRTVQPHRIANVENRIYLIAWDLDRADWRTFRVDRITEPRRTGARFAPRRLPDDDPVSYVRSRIGVLPSRYRVHATVHAPAERIRAEILHYGTVEPVDDTSCEVHIAAESLDWAAFCLVAIGAPFVVHGPVEAIDHMRAWGRGLLHATEAG